MSDPLQSLTGDRAGAALLRESLADDEHFAELTRAGMASFTAEWEALAPDERDRQLRAGEAWLAELDERLEP